MKPESKEPSSAQKPSIASEDPQAPNPVFKAAINRFWTDRATIKGPKQETETPEINLIDQLNNYSRSLSNLVRHRFLPSKPDKSEEKEYEAYKQYLPKPESNENQPLENYIPKKDRSLRRKISDSIRSLALRKTPTDAFHGLSKVVAPSKDGDIVRSLATRAVRARIYKDLKRIPKENKAARQELIQEAHTRDKLARDFLNQSEITVNVLQGSEPLGEQTTRYVVLEPPEREGRVEQPPVFLIPGISNDLDSVAGLVQEAAYSGRKVIAVAYPDAWLGKATPQFANAVAEDTHFGPHAALNKAMIEKLVPEGDFELWSFSTGGPIEAEILNDPKYQVRVSKAVLIAPASVVDQNIKTSLFPGLGHDIIGMKDTIHRYSFIMGGKEQKLTKEENTARAATSAALIDKVAKSMPELFQGAKVKEGGQILVISEEKDAVTKTEKGKSIFEANPQMKVATLMDAYHNTAVVEPERIISLVNRHQIAT